MTATILVVDDHPMIRQGLVNMLNSESEFQVIGEAIDGLDALRLIELKHPDILIIDLMMPNINGLEVLKQIKNLSPGTRRIVFSMQSADSYVMAAIKAGANGYVLKEANPSELIAAIKSVMQGNRYFSEGLEKRVNELAVNIDNLPSDTYETLSTRERGILQMTAEGGTSTDIGEKLGISSRTVEIHRSNFMKKLGLQNHTELIRFAIKRGILPLDE